MFGCLCYVHNQRHGGDKFDTRSNQSIFIGYPFDKKGWKVYNIDTRIIFTSRDVIFREKDFPYGESFMDHSSLPPASIDSISFVHDEDTDLDFSPLSDPPVVLPMSTNHISDISGSEPDLEHLSTPTSLSLVLDSVPNKEDNVPESAAITPSFPLILNSKTAGMNSSSQQVSSDSVSTSSSDIGYG